MKKLEKKGLMMIHHELLATRFKREKTKRETVIEIFLREKLNVNERPSFEKTMHYSS